MPPTFLTMRHPEVDGVARTTQAAFDQIHSGKGWELVDEADVPAAVLGKQSLEDLTVAELDELIASYGLDVPAGAKKADKVTLVQNHLAAQEG